MRRWLAGLATRSIAGLVVFIGLIAWSYVLTRDWPSEPVLVGASLGGLASPIFWGLVRKIRGPRVSAPGEPASKDSTPS